MNQQTIPNKTQKAGTSNIPSANNLLDILSSKDGYDQVNVRIPMELNDWLNDIVRQTKRLHGSKIPKESLITAAIYQLRLQELDWTTIKNDRDLIKALIK